MSVTGYWLYASELGIRETPDQRSRDSKTVGSESYGNGANERKILFRGCRCSSPEVFSAKKKDS